MNRILKKFLCCMLSCILIFATTVPAFATEDTETTPVIVINDIFANPIYNTDDGSIVFNLSDFQVDILFTSGFSSEITDLFSKDVIDQITSGEMAPLDVAMLLIDYLGYSGDINQIINKGVELISSLMGSVDTENIDINEIISNIDFNQYINNIKAQIEDLSKNLELIRMNNDGSPYYENIGVVSHNEPLEYYYDDDYATASALAGQIGESIAEEIGYENTYVFTYDWRLDPLENAELLNEFVEYVKSNSDSENVSIISEGYGSTIATTYLAEYENDAADSVKNFVTVSSEFLGTSIIGDFFQGNMVNELSFSSFTSAYIRYTNDVSDNPITAFTTWLINYILNSKNVSQRFCYEVSKILSATDFFLKQSGITAEIAKMPGIWALVPVNDYDAALDYLCDENTNAELLEKIDIFKEWQYDYEYILQNAKDSGINVSVVAAWDIQIIPLGKNNGVQSDGIVDTAYASFGATCIDINDVGNATKATQAYEDNHKHISTTYDMLTPWFANAGICKYIDASTCALPENTWFIKGMKHGTFNWESNSMEFIMWLVTADGERTVWQNAAYKQFMAYNRYINPGILNADGIVSTPSDPGTYLLGDINLDGLVTSYDAQLALQIAAGDYYIEEDSVAFTNADIYKDGIINEADARKILLMSSGLIDDMQSGIKFNFDTQDSEVINSDYEIKLETFYNPVKNQLEVSVFLDDAKDSSAGNFIIKYNTDMFTYASTTAAQLTDGYVVSGMPIKHEGTLTCAFAVTDSVTKKMVDSNGDLFLTTFYLDVTKTNIKATDLTAGTSYFYDYDVITFITPVDVTLDEDYFFMLGDATNNRYLTAQDARTILRIAADMEDVTDDEMFRRCDVNKDGEITAIDARYVLRASADLIDRY